MFVAVFLIFILFLLFIRCRNRKTINGFPILPGALPILGNAHMLLGDNVHLFNFLKRFGEKALENDGYVVLLLGLFKPIYDLFKFIQKLSVNLLETTEHFVLLLGPFKSAYVILDPEDCATILNGCLDKTNNYAFSKAWLGDGLITSNAQTWKKNRKFLNPMFNLPQVRKFLPIFNKHARRLVRGFEEQKVKGAFNPEPDIMIVSLESICQTVLGADVSEHLFTNKNYVEAIDSLSRIFVTRFKNTWMHTDFIFNWTSLKKKQDEKVKVINTLSIEHIKRRTLQLESGEKEPMEDIEPFLSKIIHASKNEDFTEENILHEINTLIATGYDTTANALVLCLMLLGHHQDVQAKLYAEMKEVFGDIDRDVDKDDIIKLVYLEAVMKESLRLFPIAPLIGRTATETVKLKNHIIPAGCDILISIYALNRHPQWGLDANQFRPERWLDGTAPTNPNLFATFSLGKRNCIGKTYSSLAFKTMLTHVIRRFHVSADISKMVLKLDTILRAASGQQIILKPRM